MPDPSQSCSLPRVHPFDPSILPYLSQPRPIVCKIRQPFLTYVDEEGRLRWNSTALEESGYGLNSLSCRYQSISRPPKDDFSVVEGPELPFPNDERGVLLDDDFVSVSCYNFAGFSVYANIHGHVKPKRHKVAKVSLWFAFSSRRNKIEGMEATSRKLYRLERNFQFQMESVRVRDAFNT